MVGADTPLKIDTVGRYAATNATEQYDNNGSRPPPGALVSAPSYRSLDIPALHTGDYKQMPLGPPPALPGAPRGQCVCASSCRSRR